MKNKLFKKLIGLIVVVAVVICSVSCKENVDLKLYVSQLRLGVYQGAFEDYKITAFAEDRETPFLLDGFVGTKEYIMTVKVEKQKGSCDGVFIKLDYDDVSVESKLEYNPLNGKFISEIKVSKLPTSSSILATIKCEELECSCELTTQKNAGTISYENALNSLKNSEPSLIKNLFETTNICTEIHIRLIAEGDKNYYYIGLVDKDGKIKAFLIDGLSGEVLAKRT